MCVCVCVFYVCVVTSAESQRAETGEETENSLLDVRLINKGNRFQTWRQKYSGPRSTQVGRSGLYAWHTTHAGDGHTLPLPPLPSEPASYVFVEGADW